MTARVELGGGKGGGLRRCSARAAGWSVLAVVIALALMSEAAWSPLAPVLRLLFASVSWQRPSHTLLIAGGQAMSIEARMLGVFGGLAVAALVLFARRRVLPKGRLPGGLIAVAGAAVLSAVLDGGNALLTDLGMAHLYEPENWLRLATGTAAGAGLGLWVAPAFSPSRAGGRRWREPGVILLACELAFAAAALSGVEPAVRVAELLAAAGVWGAWTAMALVFCALLRARRPAIVASAPLVGLAMALLIGLLRGGLEGFVG